MRVLATLLTVTGAVLVCAAPGFAATLTVTTTNDLVTAHDGLCSLREAIDAVDAPPGNGECGAADMKANTIVLASQHYALFKGPAGIDDNDSGDLNISGPTTSLTITGNGPDATFIEAWSLGDRVLQIASTAPAVTVAQLTIAGGFALPGQDGGAIDNAGTLTLTADTLTANHAGDGVTGVPVDFTPSGGSDGGSGGAVGNTGTLTVANTTVRSNTGGAGGTGSAAVHNTVLTNGGDGGAGGGGAIVNEGGTVMISGTTITANHAGRGGAGGAGGVEQMGPISYGYTGGNGGPAGGGGGVDNNGGSLTVTNSTIAGNFSGDGGDGGNDGNGDLNYAGSNGGTGGNGGGILLFAGTTSLIGVTISANMTGTPGAPGLYASTSGMVGFPGHGDGFASVVPLGSTIRNSIIAFNPGVNCSGPPAIDGGHDMTEGAVGCPGVDADPKLGPLQDNGGPTQTMALLAGSPAIDQVPAIGAGCTATDQRGVLRPQFAACDIGAFEVAAPPPVVPVAPAPALPLVPPPIVAVSAPVLSKLKLSPSRFHAAAKGSATAPSARRPRTGTTISYLDSQAAITTLTIERQVKGVRLAKGERCTRLRGKRPKHATTCTLTTRLGHISHKDRVGADSVHFSGRVSSRTKLAKGAYLVVLSAKGAAAAQSKALTGHFTVTG